MKQKNPKLMIALAGLGVAVFLGFVYSMSHSGSSGAAASKQSNNSNSMAAYDFQSGDTNTEVLNTVVANQKKLAQKNAELEQEVQKGQAQQIGAVKNTFTDQLNAIKDQLQNEINTQRNTLAGNTSSNSNANNSQNNAGYFVNGGSSSFGSSQQPGGVIGTIDDISQAFSQPISQNAAGNITAVYNQANSSNTAATTSSQKQNQPTLMYSIPDGSTIGSVYMMTATLAEVPVSGRLIAPAWPFKAIIGSQDLMGTNGQMLPSQISGAIIQGHAVGNMGQRCANLYVDKITYTFNDGHFWVYPNDSSDNSSSNDGTQVYPNHSLGYLALPDGTQCITGVYLTDAPQVLLNLTALGAAANAGNVMANQQVSTVSNTLTGQTGTNITGSAGKLFGWSALSGGSTAALNYYQQRVSDIFDAIFLPSSTNHQPTKLIFNVQKTIPIDYDSSAVMNSSKTNMSSNLNNLD